MSNELYKGSTIERVAALFQAATGFQFVAGDYEAARKQGQRHPVILKLPDSGEIISFEELEHRDPEIDAWGHIDETVEMIVTAQSYAAALDMMTTVWRLGIKAPLTEAPDQKKYPQDIVFGRVRKGRAGEHAGVPTSSIVLVDLLTIRWTLASQKAHPATVEGDSQTGIMQTGSHQDISEAPPP